MKRFNVSKVFLDVFDRVPEGLIVRCCSNCKHSLMNKGNGIPCQCQCSNTKKPRLAMWQLYGD